MPPIEQFPIPTKLATKADVGLGNVDNTSDAAKPISAAVQAALDLKRNAGAIALSDLSTAGASAGQVPKFNGTAVVWDTDNVGAGGGGGGLTSFAGRTGPDITPQSGDYSFAQIGAKPTTLSGYGITDATPSSHIGAGGVAHAAATTSVSGFMSSADKLKLDGVALGATANSPDAALLDRSNHVGAQAIGTVTGLQAALDAKAPINNPNFTGTVGGITRAMVGLGNVDNTSDAAKPVSTAQAAAISTKNENVQFQAAGTNLGTPGTVNTVNFSGLASASRSGNVVTINVAATAADVGLGNVNNTSDATKNAAVATLTNKTISGANNTLTDIPQSAITSLVADLAAKAPLTPVVENIPTGSAYTLVVGDNGKIKRGVDAAAQTVNITTTFNGLGCTIEWLAGAGTITLDAGAGVNLNGLGDGVNITLSQAAGAVTLIPSGANTWDVVGAIGDLTMADVTDASANGRSLVTAADYAAMRALLSLVPGTNVQSYSAVLATLSGASANGQSLATAADYAAMRTLLGLVIGTNVDAFAATASQAEAEAGTGTSVRNWTPQRIAQAIAALGGGGGGAAPNFTDGASWAYLPQGRGNSSWTNIGMGAPTGLGTASGIFGDFNGDDGYHNRILYTSTAAAAASAGVHVPVANGMVAPGASTRHPVQKFKVIWANADAQTGARGGAGLAANAGAPGASVEPSTFVNGVFMGYDTGDTQYSLYHNDGAGTCTKITLNGGTGFAVNDNATKLFALELLFYPGAGDTRRVEYACKNLTDAITVTGSIVASATGGIPADTSVMQPFVYRNTSAGTTAVACVIVGMYGGGFSGL